MDFFIALVLCIVVTASQGVVDVVVLYGNDITLKCPNESSYNSYSWQLNGSIQLKETSQQYKIYRADERSAGTYSCSGISGDFNFFFEEFKVIVEGGWSTEGSTHILGILPGTFNEVASIKLTLSTREDGVVNYTIKANESILSDGSITRQMSQRIQLDRSYLVTSENDRAKGIEVSTGSTKKISVVVSSKFQNSAYTYQVFPTWGYGTDEYVYYSATVEDTGSDSSGHATSLLVSANNDSLITLTAVNMTIVIPSDLAPNGTDTEVPAGNSINFTLNYLQTFLIRKKGQLSGLKITSNKPIAFFSGHECAEIPEGTVACDAFAEQIPPTISWGIEFFFTSFASRPISGSYIQAISSENNTTLKISCTNNSYTMFLIQAGNFDYRDIVANDDYCYAVADKPVCLIQYGYSFLYRNPSFDFNLPGDPMMIIVPPVHHYVQNSQVPYVNEISATDTYINLIVTSEHQNFNSSHVLVNGSSANLTWVGFTSPNNLSVDGYISKGIEFTNGLNIQIVGADYRFTTVVYGFAEYQGYGYVGSRKLLPYAQGAEEDPMPPTGLPPVIERGSEIGVSSNGYKQYNISHNICLRPPKPFPDQVRLELLCGQRPDIAQPSVATWMFNSGNLTSSHKLSDANVSVSGKNEALLITYISNGNIKDTSTFVGTYACNLRNAYGSDADTTVIALSDIEITGNISGTESENGCDRFSINAPLTLCAFVGETVTISCYSSSNTMVTTPNGKRYHRDLKIMSVNDSHAGNYTCISASPCNDLVNLTLTLPGFISVSPSPNTTIVNGDSAILDCMSMGIPAPVTMWEFNENIITNSSKYTIDSKGILTIRAVESSDSGLYICTANNGRQAVGSVTLNVQGAPVFTQVPQNKTGIHGHGISFQCAASGVPIPIMNWILPNISGSYTINCSAIENNTNTITLHLDDNIDGYPNRTHIEIFCQASNQIGTITSKAILTNNYPASVLQISGGNTPVLVNSTLILNCDFLGQPRPTILWYRRTYDTEIVEAIEASNIITIENKLINNQPSSDLKTPVHFTSSVLNISNMTLKDAGTYTCSGNNIVQSDIDTARTHDFNVIVHAKPSISTADNIYSIMVVRNESIDIKVIVTGYPPVKPSNLSWTFYNKLNGEFQIRKNKTMKYNLSLDRRMLSIIDVQPSDEGMYRIVADNEAGEAEIEVNLTVFVEVAIRRNYSIVYRDVRQKASFECTADGFPRPQIKWRKDGQILINGSKYSIKSEHTDSGFRPIPSLQQEVSTLTVERIRMEDNGTYSCRADNEAEQPVVNSGFILHVNEPPPPPNHCSSSPCQNNGDCRNLGNNGYLCTCKDGFTGSVCREVVVQTVDPRIEINPENTKGELQGRVSLTCKAIGNPKPQILWYRDGNPVENNNKDQSELTVEQLYLDDRGFYHCEARSLINGRVVSVNSTRALLSIKDVFQYQATVITPIMDSLVRKRQAEISSEMKDLIAKINEYLTNNNIIDEASFFLVEIFDTQAIQTTDSQQIIPILITLVVEERGSEELLQEVKEEMQNIGTELNINITVGRVDRFDGCQSNTTIIPSPNNDETLKIVVQWPETNIGETATVKCPCGNSSSGESGLLATRYCGGNFQQGGQWSENPDITACNFSVFARKICQLSQLETSEKIKQLDQLTMDENSFGSTEVAVSVSVLVSATENIAGNRTLTETFLNVVDNLLAVDEDTLQESQEVSNSSARVLDALQIITENIPIENTSMPVVISRNSFAVSVQLVDQTSFELRGQTFSANFGSSFDESRAINQSNLAFMESAQATASLALPNTLFDNIPSNSNTSQRITHSVFITDNLFLRRIQDDFSVVGSIIISASLVGYSNVRNIQPSVNITFLKNPNIMNGTNPKCSFWNQSLDDGYGSWSSEGCHREDNNNSSQNFTKCFCNHLTSFSILLDVSPMISPTDQSPLSFFLDAVTYTGIIVSLVCLMVTIVSYIGNKKLRSSEHGQLLINLCCSLCGLYLTFIFAIHSKTLTSICVVMAALLQYFFLVTFMLMATEAINLYMKLVVVLGRGIPHFVLKATLLCWLTPIVIVLFCFAPNYKNYARDHFCRSYGIPYYVGMIVPFILIYIFNWIVFTIIMISLLRKSCGSGKNFTKEKVKSNSAFVRQQLVIVTTLSILFGLGWGIGMFATQDAHENKVVRDLFASLFVVITAFHGLFIFIMHSLRSNDVRSTWKKWFCGKTGQGLAEFSSATYGRIRNRIHSSQSSSNYASDTLERKFWKKKGGKSPKSPGTDSSVFTFDDGTLKKRNSSAVTEKPTSKEWQERENEEAITQETVEMYQKHCSSEEVKMSKEEEAMMGEAALSYTVTGENEQEEVKKDLSLTA